MVSDLLVANTTDAYALAVRTCCSWVCPRLQARLDIQTQQHLALTLNIHRLRSQLRELQYTNGDKQTWAEEQQGVWLVAQRKLYAQQGKLGGSLDRLKREVEALAVEQTLQVCRHILSNAAGGCPKISASL